MQDIIGVWLKWPSPSGRGGAKSGGKNFGVGLQGQSKDGAQAAAARRRHHTAESALPTAVSRV